MRRLTTQEVKERLSTINPNITIIGEYVRQKDPLLCECNICKHRWSPIWGNLEKGRGCPLCYKNSNYHPSRQSIEEIKNKLAIILSDVELCEDQVYKNQTELLKWRCRECGRTWFQSWSNLQKLQKEHGCTECNKKKPLGSYNIITAERNKQEWLNVEANLYKIKIFDDFEIFYKIGITTQSIKKRFTGRMPYDYELLELESGNLYELTIKEQQYHESNVEVSYIPKKYFDGCTECYRSI